MTFDKYKLQLVYNVGAGVLILLALIGKLEIYYKTYGHPFLKVYSNLSIEIYIIHGTILKIFPYMTTVSYQNTSGFFIWLMIQLFVTTTIVALAFKIVFTSPLINLAQILISWVKSLTKKEEGSALKPNAASDSTEQPIKVGRHEKED